MTSVKFQNADVSSPVELDFEQSTDDVATRQRSPDVELLRHGGRRRSQSVEVRDDVSDNDGEGRRRRVSLKPKTPSVDDLNSGERQTTEQDTTEPVDAADTEKPLSSGWAAALAAASAAGSVRAAAKRRTNVGRSNTFMPPPTRSLFCLSLTNPLRKLTINIVEWKYPFHSRMI